MKKHDSNPSQLEKKNSISSFSLILKYPILEAIFWLLDNL